MNSMLKFGDDDKFCYVFFTTIKKLFKIKHTYYLLA